MRFSRFAGATPVWTASVSFAAFFYFAVYFVYAGITPIKIGNYLSYICSILFLRKFNAGVLRPRDFFALFVSLFYIYFNTCFNLVFGARKRPIFNASRTYLTRSIFNLTRSIFYSTRSIFILD